MIDKNLANEILTEATSKGADFAEIFIENNDKSSISLVNGKVNSSLSGLEFGLGIRLFYNGKTIYAYTNDLSRESLLKMASEVAKSTKSNRKINILNFDKTDYKEIGIHKAKILPTSIKKTKIVDMLKEASDTAFCYDNLITETISSYMHSIQDVCIINTKGLFTEDRRVRTRFSIDAIASNETEKQTGSMRPGALMGFEFYDTINLNDLAKEASRSAVTMLKAKPCPSGKMPVVIDNGFGGVIFHEACGHGLEAIKIARGDSVFAGKIGQKVASDKVTAIDDGTIPNKWGSINIDDEGTKTQKTVLIENGILKNYLVDNFYGEKIGMKSTGSCRRESYKYAPVPRMRNTFIANGDDKKEDIIKNTKKGIYAKYMGGGSVNPATGEFNFNVQEAYLIENGKITTPVRGATLIGKGEEVLKDIDMVSNTLSHAEGICGASSGSVPTCVGQPMIRVSKITVGGRS
ncbi:TldD/PmbA family protein [[Clostridium] colinum]|uniref:TldD/PmbA family protein n=1 Tax=[Clostridium] colinum TaxID=36835 RepID=UPI0020259299|nr:TldD/PmbA family protein [[Clostridium] colinum]